MSNALGLLPGVYEEYVRERLAAAGGKEVESGKFQSPDSSAALAVNAFAWFHSQPALLPLFPGTQVAGWPATGVEVEYCVRFPWSGGRHPWLDASVETDTHIIGVESKRHEPFRDSKSAKLSDAYDRPVWGKRMGPFEALCKKLRARTKIFAHLDAAQLVKHAFGLVTEARRKKPKQAILVYLYAEPARWPAEAIARHRDEVAQFASDVSGASVLFRSVRWRDWIATWTAIHDATVAAHGKRLLERFDV